MTAESTNSHRLAQGINKASSSHSALTVQTLTTLYCVETVHLSIRASECWIAKPTVPHRSKRNCGLKESEAPTGRPLSAGRRFSAGYPDNHPFISTLRCLLIKTMQDFNLKYTVIVELLHAVGQVQWDSLDPSLRNPLETCTFAVILVCYERVTNRLKGSARSTTLNHFVPKKYFLLNKCAKLISVFQEGEPQSKPTTFKQLGQKTPLRCDYSKKKKKNPPQTPWAHWLNWNRKALKDE